MKSVKDNALVVAFSAAMGAGIISNVVGDNDLTARFALTYGTGTIAYAASYFTQKGNETDVKKRLLKR